MGGFPPFLPPPNTGVAQVPTKRRYAIIRYEDIPTRHERLKRYLSEGFRIETGTYDGGTIEYILYKEVTEDGKKEN